LPTGSPAVANTIGIVDVACFAARGPGVLWETMTSTLSRTSSVARSLKRSVYPSAQRYSIARLRPSTQPSSRIRCTKAAVHWLSADALPAPSNPIVAAFACWARAVSGHAAAAPRSVMSSRRFTAQCLHASTEKDSTTGGSAAVRDFDPAYVSYGSMLLKKDFDGGNITGFSAYDSELAISGKWIEILKEVNPHLDRVASVFNPQTAPYAQMFLRSIEAA